MGPIGLGTSRRGRAGFVSSFPSSERRCSSVVDWGSSCKESAFSFCLSCPVCGDMTSFAGRSVGSLAEAVASWQGVLQHAAFAEHSERRDERRPTSSRAWVRFAESCPWFSSFAGQPPEGRTGFVSQNHVAGFPLFRAGPPGVAPGSFRRFGHGDSPTRTRSSSAERTQVVGTAAMRPLEYRRVAGFRSGNHRRERWVASFGIGWRSRIVMGRRWAPRVRRRSACGRSRRAGRPATR